MRPSPIKLRSGRIASLQIGNRNWELTISKLAYQPVNAFTVETADTTASASLGKDCRTVETVERKQSNKMERGPWIPGTHTCTEKRTTKTELFVYVSCTIGTLQYLVLLTHTSSAHLCPITRSSHPSQQHSVYLFHISVIGHGGHVVSFS